MKVSVLRMQRLLSVSALIVVAAAAAADLTSHSRAGRALLRTAERVLNENNNNNADYSYIAEYSIKFQGCHHVQQWNDNVDEESDVRIMTKRLARFRLCPTDQCSNDKSAGCTSHYGDYIVDVSISTGSSTGTCSSSSGSTAASVVAAVVVACVRVLV